MKNNIYKLFIAILAIGFMASCTEEWGTQPGNDPSPVVTIYSNPIPATADPDATINLRFVPNSQCSKFYVLIETKADKDAFIASNGEAAYAERVVANGTQYTSEITDILDETLANVYAITVVGVTANGAKGKPNEFIFNGIHWELVGTALYYDASFNLVNYEPAEWYKSTNTDPVRYKIFVTMSTWGNYERVMKLSWNTTTGALTFYNGTQSPRAGYWMFPTPFTHATYGAYSQEIDLDPDYSYYDNGEIVMDTRRVVSAGTFAGWYPVHIILP